MSTGSIGSIGYTTGTFDDIHPGHIEFLKLCKKTLGKGQLIVGLVTDDLACKQKRDPFQPYEQRKAILDEFPFVDSVVAHKGDSKILAHKKLQFTHLFIGDEYLGTEEYKVMEDAVKVFYFPCPLNRQYSSTDLRLQRNLKASCDIKYLCNGVCGPILMYLGSPHVVWKFLHISTREAEGVRTSNVYKLPIPAPRNYKKLGEEHKHPMLPGVNSYREIDIFEFIRLFSWCGYVTVNLVHENKLAKSHEPRDDFQHIRQDKQTPAEVYNIIQVAGDYTLREWIESNEQKDDFLENLRQVMNQIKSIVNEHLIADRIVHGDLHADNVLLKAVRKAVGGRSEHRVMLIDWGWCMHDSFEMSDEERVYFEECLKSQWDWQHFKDSLEYLYHKKHWFTKVQV